jgi:hypothetical protein
MLVSSSGVSVRFGETDARANGAGCTGARNSCATVEEMKLVLLSIIQTARAPPKNALRAQQTTILFMGHRSYLKHDCCLPNLTAAVPSSLNTAMKTGFARQWGAAAPTVLPYDIARRPVRKYEADGRP